MKIATWNVNSIRARQEHIVLWLQNNPIDILCLQETKVKNEQFPTDVFAEMGYESVIHGQPAYNGVAFLSKLPLSDIQCGFLGGDLNEQKRVIRAKVGDVSLINIYAPQGESPDSHKFEMKREFYALLEEMLKNEYSSDEKVLLCGDLNICPEGIDTHDVEKMTGRCMFTEEERGWIKNLLDWGMIDSFRKLYPEEQLFSWWDYRENSFRRNKGLRIDHILVTESLMKSVKAVEIHKAPRSWERPSDHVPVCINFE